MVANIWLASDLGIHEFSKEQTVGEILFLSEVSMFLIIFEWPLLFIQRVDDVSGEHGIALCSEVVS